MRRKCIEAEPSPSRAARPDSLHDGRIVAGIESHETPFDDFQKQPSRQDGGTMCTERSSTYVKARGLIQSRNSALQGVLVRFGHPFAGRPTVYHAVSTTGTTCRDA